MGAAMPALTYKENILDVKFLQKGTNTIQTCNLKKKKSLHSKLYKSKAIWDESDNILSVVARWVPGKTG